VIVRIYDSLAPATASRVTAVPLRSWKVSPVTPAFLSVFAQVVRNPSAVRGVSVVVVRILTPTENATGRAAPAPVVPRHRTRPAAFSGPLTGTATRRPPFG